MNRMFVISTLLFFPYALIGMDSDSTDLENLSRHLGSPVIRRSLQNSQEISAQSSGESLTPTRKRRKKKSAHSQSIKKLLTYAKKHGIIAWRDTDEHTDLMYAYLKTELVANDAIVAQAAVLLDAPDELGRLKLTEMLFRLALRSAQQLCKDVEKESEKEIDTLEKLQELAQKKHSDLENEIHLRDLQIAERDKNGCYLQ